MTDYNPVVGLPYVVTNELEQLLRSACGEDAAQALVPTLIFMRTNALVSEIIKSHAQHLPVGWRDRDSFSVKLDFWLPRIADRLFPSFVTRLAERFPTWETEQKLIHALVGTRVDGLTSRENIDCSTYESW